MADIITDPPRKPVTKACPKKIREQIKGRSDDLDFDGLWRWYERHCPQHLRGLAPDVAAMLSVFPPTSRWSSAGVTIGE